MCPHDCPFNEVLLYFEILGTTGMRPNQMKFELEGLTTVDTGRFGMIAGYGEWGSPS